MKIIGKDENGNYIAQVSHTEIEKFLNEYYGNMGRLKPGEEVDLGLGHDFKQDIERAMNTTQTFIKDNAKIVSAILNGLQVVLPKEGES